MLAKQADVVGRRERLFGKARDGFHHSILVNVYSEVSPIFRVACYYFCTLARGGRDQKNNIRITSGLWKLYYSNFFLKYNRY